MKSSESGKQRAKISLATWALALILALFWVLALAASPGLHELVHPDAGHEDHDCAVTVFLSGGFGQVVAEPVIVRQPDLELAYLSPSEIREMAPAGPTTSEHRESLRILSDSCMSGMNMPTFSSELMMY